MKSDEKAAKAAKEVTVEDFPKVYRDVCKLVGIEGAIRLSKGFGGQRIYIPSLEGLGAKVRNKMIRKEFTGANMRELARKYRLTETWVRQILKQK